MVVGAIDVVWRVVSNSLSKMAHVVNAMCVPDIFNAECSDDAFYGCATNLFAQNMGIYHNRRLCATFSSCYKCSDFAHESFA